VVKIDVKKIIFIISCLTIFFLGLFLSVDAAPVNVENTSYTFGSAETRATATAGSASVQGGNVTEMNITQVTQTQYWQGFWGQVDYEMRLEDASGNVFYNWSVAAIQHGEVYFSNNSVLQWDTGLTNSSDANVSFLQTEFDWANTTSSDSLSQTYNRANGHQEFNVSLSNGDNLQINRTSTAAVNLEGGIFNCTMLWYDTWELPIWASIINPDQTSFNGEAADFEVLLPVRGPKTAEIYYAFLEIE